MTFRDDINALRAIAVVAVLVYHFYPTILPGGFLGVDVFFVVSGYLIGEIFQRRDFLFVDFLRRRLARLLPLIIVFIPIAIAVSVTLFRESVIAKSMISGLSAASFASNIFFWRSASYFDPLANEEIFLHTWSLSIEVQFYFCFAVLVVLCRLAKLQLWKMIFVCAVLSLLLCLVSVFIRPTATFFLFPTRIWEFLVGAMISRSTPVYFSSQRNTMGFLLLVLIILSMFYFSGEYINPALPNFVVVVLTSCFILLRSNLSLFDYVLVREIGLASYSIYLFHFIFVAIIANILLAGSEIVLAFLFLSLALGWLFYWLFDVPASMLRRNKILFGVVGGLIPCSIFVLLSSYLVRPDEIIDKRLELENRSQVLTEQFRGNTREKLNGVAIIGDSLAEDVLISLRLNDFDADFFSFDGSCFLEWFEYSGLPVDCDRWRELSDFVRGHDTVIVATNFQHEGSLDPMLRYYADFPDTDVIFVNALSFTSVEQLSYKYRFLDSNFGLPFSFNELVFDELDVDVGALNQRLDREAGVRILDKFSFFCNPSTATCRIHDDGNYYFYDNLHLTGVGARNFGKFLLEELRAGRD